MAELITFYGLKSCDTCRAARKALTAAGVAFADRDVRDQPPGPEALADWLARVGVERLINRRSTTWRSLDAAEKAAAMTEAGAVRVLTAHPALMKRPVIVAGDAVHVGWGDEVSAALL